MPKISKAIVDANLRNRVFTELDVDNECGNFYKINDRQYGIILTDLNGVERYVRIGAIVAEEREDKTARELMNEEIETYLGKQAKKAQKAADSAEKAKRDKAARLAKKAEKEAKE